MKNKKYIYEVWSEDLNTTFTCATKEVIIKSKKDGLISINAKLIHTFTASTYEEAMAIYHLRMGFEPYKPLGKSIKCPNNCGSFYYPKGSGECPYCGKIK